MLPRGQWPGKGEASAASGGLEIFEHAGTHRWEVSPTRWRVRGHAACSTVNGLPNTMSMVPRFGGKDELAPPGSRVPKIITGTTDAPEASAK